MKTAITEKTSIIQYRTCALIARATIILIFYEIIQLNPVADNTYLPGDESSSSLPSSCMHCSALKCRIYTTRTLLTRRLHRQYIEKKRTPWWSYIQYANNKLVHYIKHRASQEPCTRFGLRCIRLWMIRSIDRANPLNSLTDPPEQNGHHFADDVFKCIFWAKMFEFR